MSRTRAAKLDRLTAEQEAQLSVYRERWIEIGLSTEPGDRRKADDAICRAYGAGYLQSPERIIHEPSPLHGAATAARLRDMAPGKVYSVWDRVEESIWDGAVSAVWAGVTPDVWDRVMAAVRDPVEAAAGAGAAAAIRAALGDSLAARVDSAGHGQLDAPHLAFYEYFLEVCGLTHCERVRPLMDLARDAGWWWPYESVCIVTDKPTALCVDDRGRLHSTTGPAIDYAGTWGIWAVHGVRVPREVVEHPRDIHASTVLAESNAEVARVMLDQMGIERFVAEARPLILHNDTDGAGQPRRLLAIETPNDPDGQIIVCEVTCPSTARRYLLRVPPNIQRCDEAIAWSFGLDVEQYHPLVEA